MRQEDKSDMTLHYRIVLISTQNQVLTEWPNLLRRDKVKAKKTVPVMMIDEPEGRAWFMIREEDIRLFLIEHIKSMFGPRPQTGKYTPNYIAKISLGYTLLKRENRIGPEWDTLAEEAKDKLPVMLLATTKKYWYLINNHDLRLFTLECMKKLLTPSRKPYHPPFITPKAK